MLHRTERSERDDRLECAEPICATRPRNLGVRTGADAGQADSPRRVRWRVGCAHRLRRPGVASCRRCQRRVPDAPANPPARGRGLALPAPPPHSNSAAATSHATDNVATRADPTWDRSPVPPVAASEAEEREFRRLDANGDAGGAFNLGVVLQQRADVEGAMAAYERAEQRGDPDAAFNLGVLLYEAGDLDGANAAWRRSAGRGHVRAAANLLFLSRRRRELERGISDPVPETAGLAEFEGSSYRRADESGAASGAFNLGAMLHQHGDTAGAAAAYERAEQRGDLDAAFNLGVLLYETGDLDGAEAAWRRSAARGHARAAGNLEFLLRHRHELETAGVAGEEGREQVSDAVGHRPRRPSTVSRAVSTRRVPSRPCRVR